IVGRALYEGRFSVPDAIAVLGAEPANPRGKARR
ncbi:MAG: bifunctional 1-(5-phosphoribosyl)-5-((5-phosphoribosylamino)methylideneamino)imidazole-4-carboxamide isomerase/phosphoribosylanthranilate isomerase PriA, partial [Thermoleophilia bacterium]|nr:bifunctional 1-(5-phosphoribosyl)-5-((5-phosphoribosylamino)methylideneamino)imidazole-4-carboxamide isomerase/phosphoribosylanthranilate isomerase PriA [Thermoleophilia bacterium]